MIASRGLKVVVSCSGAILTKSAQHIRTIEFITDAAACNSIHNVETTTLQIAALKRRTALRGHNLKFVVIIFTYKPKQLKTTNVIHSEAIHSDGRRFES